LEVPLETPANEWLVAVFLLAFTLLAWVNYRYPNWLKVLMSAFSGARSFTELIKDELETVNRVSYLLNFVFLLICSVFVWQIIQYRLGLFVGLPGYLLIMSVILAYLIGLLILFQITIFILGKRELITQHVFGLLTINNFVGLILLPIVICISYLKWFQEAFMYIGLICLALAILYRIARSFYSGFTSTTFSRFYIILYICTLEILPLAAVIAVFIEE